MEIIIGWIILSFIIAFIGSDRKIGYFGTLVLSLLLSPIIGAIFALASQRVSNTTTYKTPVYESKDDYAATTIIETNTLSKVEQLEKLGELKEKGILTNDEFIKEKEKILSENIKEQKNTIAEKEQNCFYHKNEKEELLTGFRYLISSSDDENLHHLFLINTDQISFNYETGQFNDYTDNVCLINFYVKCKSNKTIYDGNYNTIDGGIAADVVLNQSFNLDDIGITKFKTCSLKIKEWNNIYEISFNGILDTKEEIRGSFNGKIEWLQDMDNE